MRRKNDLTLTKFLEVFDFNYTLVKIGNKTLIKLIDYTECNTNGLEANRYQANKDGVKEIIKDLECLYDFYVFPNVRKKLNNTDTDWKTLSQMADDNNLRYKKELLPYILEEKLPVLDTEGKKITKERGIK